MSSIIYTFCAGILGYLVAKKIKFPVPAMLGSMLAVGVYNIFTDSAEFPTQMKIISQMVTGTFIGGQISPKDIKGIPRLAKPIVLLLLLLTINTFILGLFFTHFFDFDLVTALLASVSGGLTDMSLISIDMGGNPSSVAVMQLARMLFVMLFFPSWIAFLTKSTEPNIERIAHEQEEIADKLSLKEKIYIMCFKENALFYAVITLVVSALVGSLGFIFSFPASILVFSMIGSATLHCINERFRIIPPFRIVAQLFAGTLIGCNISMATVIDMKNMIIPIIILCSSYVAINYIFSKIISRCQYLDMKTALFSSSPAGASDMALIAADLGADLTKIAVIQVVRLVYAIAVMPALIGIFVRLFM